LLSVGVRSLLEDRVGALAALFVPNICINVACSLRFRHCLPLALSSTMLTASGTYGIMNRLHYLFSAAQFAQ
jgi:hypothetical protein